MTSDPTNSEQQHLLDGEETTSRKFTRRHFLVGSGVGLAFAYSIGKYAWEWNEGFLRATTFIGDASDYRGNLSELLEGGLKELGWKQDKVRGKSVLLKPSMVDTIPGAEHIHTHPLMVQAVAETFRRWGAGEVFVAEGPAHHSDTWYLVEKTGMEQVLKDEKLEFVDLNHGEVFARTNSLGFTNLKQLMLPECLKRADLVVSVAKMKTHHWAGVTASMKNLFGLMPGVAYGWPKNVLHHHGISQSILDINATVRPHLGIIDGIIGMQGDGPIAGEPIKSNVILMGENLPALDATTARLMDFQPEDLSYLRVASGRLGPIAEPHIRQVGETVASRQIRFELPEHPHFRQFRPEDITQQRSLKDQPFQHH